MIAERIEKHHWQEICLWYTGHGQPIPDRELMPETGFMVQGLAAGFLYVTDSKLGIIEFLISNPDSNKEERDRAIDLVVKRLEIEAIDWDIKGIFITTNVGSVMKRALKHEYESVGQLTGFYKRI